MNSVSDNILITVFLSRLSLDEIMSLFRLNKRLQTICSNPELWRIKLGNEYPTYTTSKLFDLTWKDYYRLLLKGRQLPVYHHGDRIAFVPFMPNFIDQVIKLISLYVNDSRITHIVFIDQHLEPLIDVTYPALTITIKSTNHSEINKIVFTNNININGDTMYDELKSPLSKIPIYGILDFNQGSQFEMINYLNPYGRHISRSYKGFDRNELLSIMTILTSHEVNTNVSAKQWTHYSNPELVLFIQSRLENIGHTI